MSRRLEADRILTKLSRMDHALVGIAASVLDWRDGRDVTPMMLFWLREVKERYLQQK